MRTIKGFLIVCLVTYSVNTGVPLEVEAQDKVVVIPLFRNVFEPPAPVEKTGQNTSYTARDDGDFKKGVTWPSPRFTDNIDGTVTDNLTGLIWLKNANCYGVRAWSTEYADPGLGNAIDVCYFTIDGACGLTDNSDLGDWRLPNVKEMQSLVDFSNNDPSLPSGHPFTNVQNTFYWTSSTAGFNTDQGWHVMLNRGYSAVDHKSNERFVWPVRGGK